MILVVLLPFHGAFRVCCTGRAPCPTRRSRLDPLEPFLGIVTQRAPNRGTQGQ